MEQKSMTALVSAFARAYHAEHNTVTIFNDSVTSRYGQRIKAFKQRLLKRQQ